MSWIKTRGDGRHGSERTTRRVVAALEAIYGKEKHRINQRWTVWRQTPYRQATSVIVAQSFKTSDTALHAVPRGPSPPTGMPPPPRT
jgi:hypothetical protein